MRHRPVSLAALLCWAIAGCSGGTPQQPTDMAADLTTTTIRVPLQHRPMAAACSPDRPPGTMPMGSSSMCQKDTDCSDASKGQNGRCTFSRIGATCTYDSCFTDATCGAFVCQCRPQETTASPATHHCLTEGDCRTDSDCGGGYCSPSFGSCGHYSGTVAYYCHTAGDACIDDADCANPDGGAGLGGYCAYNKLAGKWQCSTSECAS